MQRNLQPAEKRTENSGRFLSVNSIFHTIQGEGPFVGTPAVFVRLAGCNLQCPMCDTEYTSRSEFDIHQIAMMVDSEIRASGPTDLIVITGGEPFRQHLTALVELLLSNGYRVQIETNGSFYEEGFPYGLVTIVCSPKTGTINRKLAPHVRAYKYVATSRSLATSIDGLPTHALEHPNAGGLARPPADSKAEIYLQPVDEKDPEANQRNLNAVVMSCLRYGHRLCLQVHKIIGVD